MGLLMTIMTVELLPATYMILRLTACRAVRVGNEAIIILMAIVGFALARTISNAFEW